MIFISALSTFLPFGGGNYAHQVSGDSDKTWAHFKKLHQRLILVPYEAIFFMLGCFNQEKNIIHSVDLLYHLQIGPIMEISSATDVRNVAQLERTRRTHKKKKESENNVND